MKLATFTRMAAPLANDMREYFLEDVARLLAGLLEIGDGAVARICAEVQQRYWRAPDLSRSADMRRARSRYHR